MPFSAAHTPTIVKIAWFNLSGFIAEDTRIYEIICKNFDLLNRMLEFQSDFNSTILKCVKGNKYPETNMFLWAYVYLKVPCNINITDSNVLLFIALNIYAQRECQTNGWHLDGNNEPTLNHETKMTRHSHHFDFEKNKNTSFPYDTFYGEFRS